MNGLNSGRVGRKWEWPDIDAVRYVGDDRCPNGTRRRAGGMAGVVAFLCSSDASYITGHTLPVDGGQAAD